MTGGTAAEMSDIERSSNQTITAGKLDIEPGTTAALDLALAFTNLTGTSQSQSFSVTNAATAATPADIYLWIDPAAGFPFCPNTGLKPVNVTIADSSGTDQNLNLCDLVADADNVPNIPNGASVPFKIADDLASGGTTTRSFTLTVDANASPAIWNFANGTAAITLYGTQNNAPAPVIP